jgi:pullulanase
MPGAEMIRKSLSFCIEYKVGIVSYCLKGKNSEDTWEQALVIFNGNWETATVPIPKFKFKVIAYDGEIDEEGLGVIESGSVEVPAVSMMLLAR